MYKPIAEQLIDYAAKQKEPAELIARATQACKQPGDSAPHNDHMHVRVYCAATDRQFGCVDIGPMELLAEREAEHQKVIDAIAEALPADVPSSDVIATAISTSPAATA